MSRFSDLLPPLSSEEYASLKADIAERGVLVPIEVDEDGAILDGAHRARAAAELGLAPPPRIVRHDLSEEAKRAHAIALNVHRRQLGPAERQALVSRLREMGQSTRTIAKTLGVGVGTVHRDLSGVPSGTPDSPDESGGDFSPPGRVTGADGKAYPAARPAGADRTNGDRPVAVEDDGHPVLEQDDEMAARPKFNRVNENIDWAWWSWNPVTGCLHNCPYCYARDIANRFYAQKFEPTFLPERLSAPQNTKLPDTASIADDPRARNVFVCSMADLFGKWVPQEWIDAVFEQVIAAPEWRFLCLTKFPQRLAELDWPENAWVGTSVDRQHRVRVAEKAFAGVKAGLRWLSCEPLLEPLQFESLDMFDWVVIGAQSRSTGAPEFQPPVEWILDLIAQARVAGARVYVKPNVAAAAPPCPTCGVAAWPKEVPWS